MLAAMLRQSTGGGSGGGGGGSGSKLSLGISRLSSSNVVLAGPPGIPKRGSESSDSPETPVSDPNYIMQLVSDVRKFADVLLQLKEVFNSKGMFRNSVINENGVKYTHFCQLLLFCCFVMRTTRCSNSIIVFFRYSSHTWLYKSVILPLIVQILSVFWPANLFMICCRNN